MIKIKELKNYIDIKDGAIDLSLLEEGDFSMTKDISKASKSSWYNFEDGKVIFKKIPEGYGYFAELLYSELAEECKVNHVKCYYAKLNNTKGILSFDFARDDFYISGQDLIAKYVKLNPETIKNEYDKLVEYNKHNNLKNVKKYLKKMFKNEKLVQEMTTDLVKMFTLDVLTCNGDRHTTNWGILMSNNARIAPLFDHENLASLHLTRDDLKNMTMEILKSNGKSKISDYLSDSGFSLLGFESNVSYSKQLLGYYKQTDEKTRNEIKSIVDNFNPEGAIKKVEKMINEKLPSDVKVFIVSAMNRKGKY